MTAAAALAIAGLALVLGRRDVTRPAVAFGVVFFGCVALAQLRLTDLERPWSDGYTALVFAGGLSFMLAAMFAGGTAGARPMRLERDAFRPSRLVVASVALLAAGVVGQIYKSDALGGTPLLSGEADVLRARALQGGEVTLSAWSSMLTDGFFLGAWCALVAIWVLRGRTSGLRIAGLWLLAAAGLFGTALMASRNNILFAIFVPLGAVYLVWRPRNRLAGARLAAVAAGVVVIVLGGMYVARIAQTSGPGGDTVLEREVDQQPAAVAPLIPFYINGVYPLEAASRIYEAVPAHVPYAHGGNSLRSLPDRAYPEGKPPFGADTAALMSDPPRPGLSWTVAGYQGRLYGDAGWPGVVLGSLILGLAFGALYRWAREHPGLLAAAAITFVAYYSAHMVYDNYLSFTVIGVYELAMVALVAAFARRRIDDRAAVPPGLDRLVRAPT